MPFVRKAVNNLDRPNFAYYKSFPTVAALKHHQIPIIIQTEAERRRREAGVKQSMELRLRSCMYYVCGYVCMVFGIISRTRARSATNGVPKCRSPERALLRHHIIEVQFLTSARREKMPK